MIRRLDNLWYRLLYTAHRWILCRVAAHCRRDMARGAEVNCRRKAVRQLRQELARQKPHLN
jgi:hypothetical protein